MCLISITILCIRLWIGLVFSKLANFEFWCQSCEFVHQSLMLFDLCDMKCFGDPMRLYFHLDQVHSLRRSPETIRARLGLVAKPKCSSSIRSVDRPGNSVDRLQPREYLGYQVGRPSSWSRSTEPVKFSLSTGGDHGRQFRLFQASFRASFGPFPLFLCFFSCSNSWISAAWILSKFNDFFSLRISISLIRLILISWDLIHAT